MTNDAVGADGTWSRAAINAVPNSLTISRLLLGIAFPFLPPSWWLATILIAGWSDLVDGAIGRMLGATTTIGRMLDPIADKAFVLAVLGTLLAYELMTIPELILLGMRDLVVLAILVHALLFRPRSDFLRMQPVLIGKIATGAQFAYLIVLIYYREPRYEWFVPAAAISVLAAARYLWLYLVAIYWPERLPTHLRS